MDIQIRNQQADGKTYRGTVRQVHYDAGAGKWKGNALWRGAGGFVKGAVESSTLDGLPTAAADLLLPEPQPE